MSAKEYIEAWDYMTVKEKRMMADLWNDGVNHDGHSWVTYGDVERVVGKIILGRVKGEDSETR